MSTQQDGGIFASTGSPPVILGFLAVGLFVVAIIILFGFRRFHHGRFNAPIARTTAFPRRILVDIGEKPKLWDVYTHRDSPKWNEMQPLSAVVKDTNAGKPQPPEPIPPLLAKPKVVDRVLGVVRRPRQNDPELPTHVDTKATENYCQVQIAVTVLMPAQHREPSDAVPEEESTVYEIGLTHARVPSSCITNL